MTSFRPNTLNYKDFDFGFEKNEITSDVKTKLGLSSISQSIKNIILTSPTERPFSTLGAGLYKATLQNATEDEFVIIKQKIIGALSEYEPRIRVEYNDINLSRDETGAIRINIQYSMVEGLGIDSVQNLNIIVQ
jgi:phage baseplate assembly protein W